MRGEHASTAASRAAYWGSSPHARGALRAPAAISAVIGDHPRMRGEHVCAEIVPRSVVGSSPHARGALAEGYAKRKCPGIIPACAGSTLLVICKLTNRGDHPRMRGEHSIGGTVGEVTEGSSPHARGALRWIQAACPGGKDHPRMRGEHSM